MENHRISDYKSGKKGKRNVLTLERREPRSDNSAHCCKKIIWWTVVLLITASKTPRRRGPKGRFISEAEYWQDFLVELPIGSLTMSSTKIKSLKERNGAAIRNCIDLDTLGQSCIFAGVYIAEDNMQQVAFIQRELMRRIAATAVMRSHPHQPTKDMLENEILISAEDYRTLLGDRFCREDQRDHSVNLPPAYVNRFLPAEWTDTQKGEVDPFLPPYTYEKEKEELKKEEMETAKFLANALGVNIDDVDGATAQDCNNDQLRNNKGNKSDQQKKGKDEKTNKQKSKEATNHDYWQRNSDIFGSAPFALNPMTHYNPTAQAAASNINDGQGLFSNRHKGNTYASGDFATRHTLNEIRRQHSGDQNQKHISSPEQSRHSSGSRHSRPARETGGAGGGGGDPDSSGDSSESEDDQNGHRNRNQGRDRNGQRQRRNRRQHHRDDHRGGCQDPSDKDRRALQGLQMAVPLFTGQMPYNFRDWFRRFELRTAGCSARQKCLGLAWLMDGHAAVLYTRLPEQIRNSYPDVVEELFRMFAPPENMETMMQRFRDHKQQQGVDVFQYVNELRTLLATVGCELPPNQYDLLIAHQFRIGLLPRWQREIARFFGAAQATLDEMVAHIATMTQVDEREQRNRKNDTDKTVGKKVHFKTMLFTEEMKRQSEQEEAEALARDIAALPYPQVQKNNQQPQAAWADTRPAKWKVLNKDSPNLGQQSSGKSAAGIEGKGRPTGCFICDQDGHWAKECPYFDEWQQMKKQIAKQIKERASREKQGVARNNAAVNTDNLSSSEEEDD